MAPRPPNIEANRFALLDSGPKKKKKRKTEISVPLTDFPFLPETKVDDPKFVVIESTDSTKPLSSHSCFAVHRAIQQISSQVHSISTLRDGKLLLLVKNSEIAEKFKKVKQLGNICAISAKLHESLNHVKGTIFAPFLNNVSEEEIVTELSSQGVVAAYKFQKTIEGKLRPSGVLLLTFNLYNLPNKIDVAWCKVLVRQYIPLPMRCKSCQLLGHTTKHCNRAPLCVNCSLPPHSPSECERTLCANCSQQHPSSSRDCSKFLQAKEIVKIKTIKKCSMREAIKTHKEQQISLSSPSSSYAAITSNLNANKNTSLTSINNPDAYNTIENNNNKDTNYIEFETLPKNTENTNTLSNFPSPINQTNLSYSTTSKSTTFTEKNIPATTNNSKFNLPSYSPPSNISYSSTNHNEIDNNFTTNNSTLPNSSYSHYAQSQTLYSPLPTLSKVLSITQNQGMSDDEI